MMIELDDDLGPIFDAPAIMPNTEIRETCGKCGGDGLWKGYGDCYGNRMCGRCKGKGYQTFKFTKQQRDERRAKVAARAERKLQNSLEAFAAEQPVVWQWMNEQAEKFEFAASLLEALKKYGRLTEKQLVSATKCAVGWQERKAKWAAERAINKAKAQDVSIVAIETAFGNARESGIKWPKLRLDTFTFSPAGESGKNPGAVYVKEGEQYLGKVLQGKFFKVRDCSTEQEERVLAAANDPKSAAIAYGKKFGSCSVCNRELSNQESIDLGIGPVCAGKFGW